MTSRGTGKSRAGNLPGNLQEEAAHVLLRSTFDFLRSNGIDTNAIVQFAHDYGAGDKRRSLRAYRELVRTYDDIGAIMSVWFSDPRFLDSAGNPLALGRGRGAASISLLIRAAGSKARAAAVMDLLQRSPSIKIGRDGSLLPLRRVFVLPKFELPRAAFIVERYFDTIRKNVRAKKRHAPVLLERNCHVSNVNLARIAPTLRNITERGTAFIDSLDGEIESLRVRRSKRVNIGELGVLVFAWTKAVKSR